MTLRDTNSNSVCTALGTAGATQLEHMQLLYTLSPPT